VLLLAQLSPAHAHVSERALVLILPTDIYMLFGVAAVALTVVLTVLVPPKLFRGLLAVDGGADAASKPPGFLRNLLTWLGFLAFAALIANGFFGQRDPLENLLVLMVFTVWWICLPLLQAVFGDIWGWINPWSAPVRLVFRGRHLTELPARAGLWPAVVTYVLAGVYTLTDIAPDDPARLATVAGLYWLFTFAMCGIFGRSWLHRGEGFTVFFDFLAQIAVLRCRPFRLQFPGAGIMSGITTGQMAGPSAAVFAISLLAMGSFDGLNETFWWMGQIGVNPLEFPGRSAVIWPNRVGLLAALILLNLAFAASVWLGLALIGQQARFHALYCRLALTLLPIALGYHLAHYLTSAMVGLQYVALALNDPWQNGMNLLGLGDFYVTTSFFNQHHTVQRIWLTQASAIVIAHIIAVILSHGIALGAFGAHRLAVISQLPVALFMVLYTFFGLWLLASPVAL
jgi:hypothetical protein